MTPFICRSAVVALVVALALPAWGQQYLYAPQPLTSGDAPAASDGILVKEFEVHKGDTLYGISRKFSGRGMYFPQILLFNNIKNPNLIYPGNILRIPISHNGASPAERHTTAPAEGNQSVARHSENTGETRAQESVPLEAAQPARSGSQGTATDLPLSDLKAAGKSKASAKKSKRKPSVLAKKRAAIETAHTPEATPAAVPSAAVEQNNTVTAAAVSDAAAGQKLFEAAVKAYRQDDCRTALELLDKYLADHAASPLAADATLYKAECFLKLSTQ